MVAVLALFWGGAAMADPRPAEMPPPDFPGAQYIDSRGCVFLRGDGRWTARLGPDGQPVCGFPPSLSARRTDPGVESPLAVATPEPETPEQRLATALAAGLRDGELTADPRPREEILPPAPVPRPTSGPLADLDAMIAAAPVLRRDMAGGLRANDRLCALLGYDGQGSRLPMLGHDATQGFCAGLPGTELAPKVAALAPAPVVSQPDEAPTAMPAAAAPAPPPVPPQPVRGAAAPSPRPVRAAAERRAPAAAPARRDTPAEMVPASARYVVVGRYKDAEAAQSMIDRLTTLGYPVARGRARAGDGATVAVLAGPFADRRSVIAALSDLRRRGHAGAVAQ